MTARPSVVAGALSVIAAGAVMVVLGGDAVRFGLLVELVGLLVVAGGLAVRRRVSSVAGLLVVVGGALLSVAGVATVVVDVGPPSALLLVVPGVVGVALLTLGVIPARGSGTRGLVKAGAGAVFLSVVVAGLFQTVGLHWLLVAGAGTVIAWDAGEHAIDVGRQLGRAATTHRLDVVHVAATVLVGVVAVPLAHVVAGVGSGALSLSSFALLFAALALLTVALHR